MFPRVIYAHRGASLELPENTLDAFRRAVSLGIRAIETDAHLTRDGHVVLSHDPTGHRMAGVPSRLRDVTLADVRTWDVGRSFCGPKDKRYGIPTLDEALAELPDAFFNVDAKQRRPDMIPALLACIREAGAQNRVRIASFSARNLCRARELGYEGETGLAPVEVLRIVLLPLSVVCRMRVAGNAVQVPMSACGIQLASERAIERFHRLGLRVDFWTINNVETARRLFAMGADGVMTDDPRIFARTEPA